MTDFKVGSKVFRKGEAITGEIVSVSTLHKNRVAVQWTRSRTMPPTPGPTTWLDTASLVPATDEARETVESKKQEKIEARLARLREAIAALGPGHYREHDFMMSLPEDLRRDYSGDRFALHSEGFFTVIKDPARRFGIWEFEFSATHKS